LLWFGLLKFTVDPSGRVESAGAQGPEVVSVDSGI
jgi:hypothetical protein